MKENSKIDINAVLGDVKSVSALLRVSAAAIDAAHQTRFGYQEYYELSVLLEASFKQASEYLRLIEDDLREGGAEDDSPI